MMRPLAPCEDSDHESLSDADVDVHDMYNLTDHDVEELVEQLRAKARQRKLKCFAVAAQKQTFVVNMHTKDNTEKATTQTIDRNGEIVDLVLETTKMKAPSTKVLKRFFLQMNIDYYNNLGGTKPVEWAEDEAERLKSLCAYAVRMGSRKGMSRIPRVNKLRRWYEVWRDKPFGSGLSSPVLEEVLGDYPECTHSSPPVSEAAASQELISVSESEAADLDVAVSQTPVPTGLAECVARCAAETADTHVLPPIVKRPAAAKSKATDMHVLPPIMKKPAASKSTSKRPAAQSKPTAANSKQPAATKLKRAVAPGSEEMPDRIILGLGYSLVSKKERKSEFVAVMRAQHQLIQVTQGQFGEKRYEVAHQLVNMLIQGATIDDVRAKKMELRSNILP